MHLPLAPTFFPTVLKCPKVAGAKAPIAAVLKSPLDLEYMVSILNFSYLGIEVATKNVITVSFERFETFSRTEFPDFECFVITGTN